MLAAGTHLGPYEIVALIGSGGMGEVYRAQDTQLKREVALKVLPDAFSQDPDRLARFQREAELLATLNHPNIAAVYGLERADGVTGIVLELVEGETLADVIARGPIALGDALAIARQIAEALEAAHEKGVIHRDLKPGNIKITPEGKVKVLDFGLAKMLESESAKSSMTMSPTLSVHATYAGVILGTAAYMSPEQARGKPVDRKTDTWAFGCVLYEMLTGTQAFKAPGETVSDAIAVVLLRDPDLNALPAETPAHVRTLIRRCLQKDPVKRLPHIGIARIEIDEGSSDAGAPAATIPVAPARISTRLLAIAGATMLAGIAISAAVAWRLKAEPARTVTRFSVLLPEGQQFTNLGRQVVGMSPDGTNIAYVANQRLYLRSMATLETHAIAGSDPAGGVGYAVFSPDGQSLAFVSSVEGVLKRVAISGGAPVAICPAQGVLGISWDEHGIVFGQAGKGILRVSPNGGVPEVIGAIKSDETAASPQMLPGGKAVLFSVKKPSDVWDKGQVVVQTLGTGVRKTLVDGGADGRYLPTGHLVYALSGVLLAVPFDLDRLAVTGGPVPVVEGIRRAGAGSSFPGSAQFSYSKTGSLVYLPGPAKMSSAGDSDLALFDGKGGVQPLKLPPGSYRSPRASPDGKSVAFDSEDEREAAVWIYDLSGTSAMRHLTFGGKNRAPIWSPDGQWIAFQSDREGDLAIFRQRADGTGTAERVTKPETGTTHSPQSWSPDGAHLLITVQKDQQFTLWTMAMKDQRMVPFGDVRSIIPTEATFSPDGRWIAYQVQESPNSTRQIFVQPFPSTGAKYLVPETTGGQPYWSRKGDQLIINAGPSRSIAVSVTMTPRLSFGRPADFSRVGRNEPSPNTGRRNADAMPDGQHVIGVTTAGLADSGSATASQMIIVVLNWFTELQQRVPTR